MERTKEGTEGRTRARAKALRQETTQQVQIQSRGEFAWKEMHPERVEEPGWAPHVL